MTWENSAITITTLLPLAGALVIALVPRRYEMGVRALGIVFTGAALAFAIAITFTFDYGASGLQFQLDTSWIPAIDARYHVGIDGISLPLFVLTFCCRSCARSTPGGSSPSPGKTKAFLALMLLLETGMAGTFIAFDLILFFVFWELVLVPMYFLIGIWGSANREYAAIKFFLYTLFGIGVHAAGVPGDVLQLRHRGGAHTFDIITAAAVRGVRRLLPGLPAGGVRGGRSSGSR